MIILVVPCYNEEKRLNTSEFKRLVQLDPTLELLFVNDGSRDGTLPMLQQFQKENPQQIRVLDLPKNGGKAEAVRQGLLAALSKGAEAVGYTDADLATPVEEIIRVKAALDIQMHYAILGSRVKLLGSHIERDEKRHYLGRIFATIASLALRLPVYDTQCGMKYFRRHPALLKSLEAPFTSRWAFDVELIGRLLKNGLTKDDFVEVPLHRWIDVAGSKLTLKAMMRAGLDLLRIGWDLRR